MKEDKWLFRTKFIKISLIVCITLAVLCMSAMMVYASSKVVVLSEEEQAELDKSMEPESFTWKIVLEEKDSRNKTDKTADTENCFVIPHHLKNADDIEVSVRYDVKKLQIVFKDNKVLYQPYGNIEMIESGIGTYDVDTTLSFTLKEACYANVFFYDGELGIRFEPVKENNKKVVVIDPGHGGKMTGTKVGDIEEKNVTLRIAREVEKMCRNKDYVVALTRGYDTYMNTEERINSIKAVDGDFYIGLECCSDVEDTQRFGMSALYNSKYYRNGLNNVSFADRVLKSTCEAAKNRAEGLIEATDEDVILRVLGIPGMTLFTGYLSNPEEALLLDDSEYIRKIAAGIVNALDEVVNLK